ncbi:MAG TPA: hypothetical protein VJ276_26585 [Thermoanaerobaculia bacterium]|nr:hypothetical protein [Thermoanaerobaculia bacterium]
MASKRKFIDGFLNVDLEVYSRRPLDLFATALGETVAVLFVGKQGTRHLAAVELAGSGWQQKPDAIIMGLVKLIRRLPEPARTLWNSASERRFDIGCEAPSGPHASALALRPSTVAAVAEVSGTIAVTIYPSGERQSNHKERREKPA